MIVWTTMHCRVGMFSHSAGAIWQWFILVLPLTTVAYKRKVEVYFKDDCGLDLVEEEVNTTRLNQILTYSGESLGNCSLRFNLYNFHGEGICFEPMSWNVSSCVVRMELYDQSRIRAGSEKLWQTWNCTTKLQPTCFNKTILQVIIHAFKKNDDNFRIRMFMDDFDNHTIEEEEDDKRLWIVTVGAGTYIGLFFGAVLVSLICFFILLWNKKTQCGRIKKYKEKKKQHIDIKLERMPKKKKHRRY